MSMFYSTKIDNNDELPRDRFCCARGGMRKLCYGLLALACLNVSGCLYITDNGLTFFKPYYTKRDREVSQADIQVLDGAIKLLKEGVGWNRNDDRLCICGETWSLFCALARSSIDVTGEYAHRRVAIQEVRFTIDDHFPERWTQHQLQDFNNHKDTRFEDVIWVLQETRKRLLKRLDRFESNQTALASDAIKSSVSSK